MKPGEKKFEVLSHVDLEEKKGREYTIFGSVAVANGHIYLSAANKTFCIGPKEFTEQNVAIPEGSKEEPAPATRANVRPRTLASGSVRCPACSGREIAIHCPYI